jgi:hypothetical protein
MTRDPRPAERGQRTAEIGNNSGKPRIVRLLPPIQANSSIGRAAVSKTAGWGFEPLLACQV